MATSLFNLITVQIGMNKLLAKRPDSGETGHSIAGDTRHKLSLRFKIEGNDWSQSRCSYTMQASKTKKQITSLDVFRQIVKEKHILAHQHDKCGYAKFSKKLISPALRTGIVTRAFSRSKLENFTRPDPNHLKMSLKCRVNSIIHKASITEPSPHAKRERDDRPFRRLVTNGDSQSRISQSRSTLFVPQHDRKSLGIEVRSKQLNLKDFAEERREIQLLQERANSARIRKPRRARENLSLIIKPVWGNSATPDVDFLPSSIKVSARRDKEIINGFNSSICLSNRGSHLNARRSHARNAI